VLFTTLYGRIEIRARVPWGKGLWPALWMLPVDDRYGGWAASGEIDLMEIVGEKPHEVLNSIHFGSTFPKRSLITTVHAAARGSR
jgi:beta-glucanase (GH16 family)